MTTDEQRRPVGPVEGTIFLVVICFAGTVLAPMIMLTTAQLFARSIFVVLVAAVLGEEIIRLLVVTVGRRIRANWLQILFAIWLPFTIMEWVTAFMADDGESLRNLGLAALNLLVGGIGHVLFTLYYLRFRPRTAFIAALLTHLAWNIAVLMAFPETRAILLS